MENRSISKEARFTDDTSETNPFGEPEGCPVCRHGEMVFAGVVRQQYARDGATFHTVRMVCDFCGWSSTEEVTS